MNMDHKVCLGVILNDIIPNITYRRKMSVIFIMQLESKAYWYAVQLKSPFEKFMEISEVFTNLGISVEERFEAIEMK